MYVGLQSLLYTNIAQPANQLAAPPNKLNPKSANINEYTQKIKSLPLF